MLPQMVSPLRPRLTRLLLGGGAVVIGLAAFAVCVAYGLTPAAFVNSPRKLSLWLGLLIWSVLARVARRVLVGRAERLRLTDGPVVVAFVLFKLSLLSAIVMMLVIWPASALVRWSLATMLFKAAMMLLVLHVIVGIAGGAAVNSTLALKRARSRVTA